MEQLQSLFKDEKDAYIFDQEKAFTYVSKREEEDEYGGKIIVTASADGKEYEWSMNHAQYDKRFTNTYPDGNVSWQGKEGEGFSVKVIKTKAGHPFFSAGPVSDSSTGTVAPQAQESKTVSTAKEVFAEDSSDSKWDGTHRQRGWRIARSGILQALIQSKTFDLSSDLGLAQLEEMADNLTVSNRKRADALEKEHPLH